MNRKKYVFLYLLPAVSGMVCFLLLYGIRVLNPLYDAWLLRGGDLTQHYIGWEFYRVSEWQFPVGLMNRIAYPNNVSVIFTDSIPVFAVLFKLLSPVLPETFQYFGWWQMLCFVLQGIFAAQLIYFFTEDEKAAAAGSLFFILAPVFLTRVFFHVALSSQWLILAALYLALKYIGGGKGLRTCAVIWGLTGMLCGAVHIYYIPMCGIIMSAFLLLRFLRDKKLLFPLGVGMSFVMGAGGMVFILGGLSHDHQLDAGGLGQFSFNMNGFVNPMGWSRLLPWLSSYGEGAGDGFAYLGLGIIILAIFAVILQISAWGRVKRTDKNLPAFLLIAVICLFVSASHQFALDGNHVYEIPYPDKLVSLWGMFRSSGRFIWPVVYLIMLWVIVTAVNQIKNKYAVLLLLGVTFFLQIYDIQGAIRSRCDGFRTETVYNSRLQDERWEEIAQGKKHIVFVSRVTQNQDILYGVSQYAYLHGMTINDFYLAHSAAEGDIVSSREESMHNLREDTIYIFKQQDESMCGDYGLEYQTLDDIIVGLKK